MRFFQVSLIIVVCMFTSAAFAQGNEENVNLSDAPYVSQVHLALSQTPARFDFMQLRILYSQSSYYDPLGEKTLNALREYAYIILNDPDPENAKTALFVYQALVSNHLAHIGVVTEALSLARQDQRFGNPKFFEWVKLGLLKTVVISGDGYTLRGAYDVITLPEEGLLFSELGFTPRDVQDVREGRVYYNMHTVQGRKGGDERTVFVNTSIPMRHLSEQKEEQERREKSQILKQ